MTTSSGRVICVVADLHGRTAALEELLRAGGALNPGGTRCHDVVSVQIGDLVNAVEGSEDDDIRALDLAARWFDVCIVGNHEHPFWGGPAFVGFEAEARVQDGVHRLPWRPSLCVPELDLLVTHAGVARGLVGSQEWTSAQVADAALRAAWDEDPRAGVFSSIGRARGGRDKCGGVLWSDWGEPKVIDFNQLVGHTPMRGGAVSRLEAQRGTWCRCIDFDCKGTGTATGALIDPVAGTVEIIQRNA